MHNPSVKTILRNYIKYRKLRRRITKVYYSRLLKASLLVSTVPLIMNIILIMYGRLTLNEGIFAALIVFFGSTFFAKPYLADLSSLTHYVEQLALDKKANAPLLSYLGNVEELSSAVRNLHRSWGNKTAKLEAAIAESKVLFDTLPDILLMLDARLNVVRANNIALMKLHNRIVGKHLSKFFDPSIIDAIEKVYKTGMRKSIDTSITTHNVRRDYKVNIELFPVSSTGNVAIVLILHDVTESTRTKQMMKDFVANASHEIRTPLTSISGFIETLQQMDKDEEEARQQFLRIMEDQTGHMARLVGDLLSLSKVEVSENTIPTDKVDLLAVLQQSVNHSSVMANDKNIQINYHEKPNSLPPIIGDNRELQQVFVNLISNAIKYSPADTTVTVTVKEKEHDIYVHIADEGEGISEEDIPRVTERFFRVDKARSRKIGGTGIGLAIVKHILNRHKAELTIESALKKGSVFTVKLPVHS